MFNNQRNIRILICIIHIVIHTCVYDMYSFPRAFEFSFYLYVIQTVEETGVWIESRRTWCGHRFLPSLLFTTALM